MYFPDMGCVRTRRLRQRHCLVAVDNMCFLTADATEVRKIYSTVLI